MCGRFALGLDDDELEEAIQALELPARRWINREQYRAGNFNVAPQNRSPVVRRAAPAAQDQNDPEIVLETMKWGLVPHWTKRPPDYGSMLRTINARDDSVLGNGGMWASMKGRKRCVVVCQGFYEWLKKGKDKVPHFTKRKDSKLMAFAGLWDSVTYEGETEPLHSFTIITTSSNKQLSFLHDRMPVILRSKADMDTWLDTSSQQWSSEVAKLLQPFDGELECYAVPKEVGKVGNNSADFIKPVSERKGNIGSFFANQAANSPSKPSSSLKPAASPPYSSTTKPEKAADDKNAKEEAKTTGKEDDEVMEVNPDELPSSTKGGKKRSKAGEEEGGETKKARKEADSKSASPPAKPKPASGGSPKKKKSPTKPKPKETGQMALTDFVKLK